MKVPSQLVRSRPTVLLASSLLISVAGYAQTPKTGAPSPSRVRSTAADRKQVAITVYNQDFGLVREVRNVKAPAGTFPLEFQDVASAIQPETVQIDSLSGKLRVLEQNYMFDLLSPQKLLEKYVGRRVRVYRWNEKLGREEVVEAEVLSVNDGQVLKIGNEITFGFPGRLGFPEVPANLMARPTLVWLLETSAANPQLQATYLTKGMNWEADYVFVLGADDAKGDITGWVTLTNQSGAAYQNAKLQLVAGDVQRVSAEEERPMDAMEGMMMKAQSPRARAFTEESFFEYHLYTMGRPVTLLENEKKQVTLLEGRGVKVTKKFLVRGASYFFHGSYPGEQGKNKVGVYLEFDNKASNGLGMPLPKGVVRVYKADSSGSRQFVGEDRIDHTPRDENIRIKTGEAFDVVAERKQTDYRVLGSCSHESSWQIDLRNHRASAAVIEVEEPTGGEWEVVSSNLTPIKRNQQTLAFVAKVPAKGAYSLKYRIRVRHC